MNYFGRMTTREFSLAPSHRYNFLSHSGTSDSLLFAHQKTRSSNPCSDQQKYTYSLRMTALLSLTPREKELSFTLFPRQVGVSAESLSRR